MKMGALRQQAADGPLNGFVLPTMIDPSTGQHFCEWNPRLSRLRDLLTRPTQGMYCICIPLYLLDTAVTSLSSPTVIDPFLSARGSTGLPQAIDQG